MLRDLDLAGRIWKMKIFELDLCQIEKSALEAGVLVQSQPSFLVLCGWMPD